MPDSPAVTVALACHNADRLPSIRAAIDSVHRQSHRPADIVVAVDHNAALSAVLRAEFRSVVVVDNDGANRGASGTRNVAAARARTPLIAFLDDDEIAAPTWLERLVAPFHDPSVVGTGGRYRPVWNRRRPFWFPDEFGWVVGAHHRGMPTTAARVRNVWAGSMAVRHDVFRSVGGFRTDFGKVGDVSRPEDTDLCIRMAAAGRGHWLFVPQSIVDHEVPPSRATLRYFAGRCYAEGVGKIEMRAALGDGDALGDERTYVTRTIPLALARNIATGRLDRAATMALGIACAAAGAASASWATKRTGAPRPRTRMSGSA
ncbi:glycosyltransferase [Actinoplanes sp. NPDC051346]|uniref:glycosyltransferase family 2 protein n=1 Tax=Actinoplanes sp. NPDC051346 TaxID=3155048 RepID=UPI003441A0A5